jgi:tRNA-splicing ligase RtcB
MQNHCFHRKGATRAFGPGHPDLPEALKAISSCHGASRRMSRHQATKQWKGRELIDYLATRGS